MAKRLGELLIEAGAIDEAQLEAALNVQRDSGRPLGMTLVRMGATDEITLIRTLASQLGFPLVRLQGKRIQPEMLETVPPDLAEKYRCLPLFTKLEGGLKALYLAMEDPSDAEAVEELGRMVQMRIRPVLVAPSELQEALARHYDWAPPSEDDADADALASMPTASDEGLEVLDFEPGDGGLSDASDGGGLLDGSAPPEFDASSPDLSPPPAAGSGPTAVAPDLILRALTQLLVEKGVISREELVERLGALESETGHGLD
jgi:hypothetical protein